MWTWLGIRLGRAALAAWLIASAVFIGSRFAAPPPEQRLLEQVDALGRPDGREVQALGQQAIRRRLGLDKPVFYVLRDHAGRWRWQGVPNQYHTWLLGLLHGQLGTSYRDGQPVGEQLRPALAYTLPLVALALALSTALALALALYLAANRAGHQLVAALLTGLQALPLFVLGLLLLLLLANPAVLNIVPAAALDGLPAEMGSLAWLADYLPRLVLPVTCLVLGSLPELALPLAAALQHELASPYIVAARARGLATGRLLWYHALPNAVLPLLSALAGLLPSLVAGAVVVEVLFALPGMGRLLAEAVATRDYPVLVAGLLLAAAARLLALLLADVAHLWLDPRLRDASLL